MSGAGTQAGFDEPPRQICLLTDFGLRDHYVGVMKGVIERLAPMVRITDLCHEVPPQSVSAGAFLLASATPYFSPETLHVAVVDPGVGTDRKIVYVETEGGRFLAPDNGVLGRVPGVTGARVRRSVENSALFLPSVSNTFHGRDIFAPVAGHLAAGVAPSELGPELASLQPLNVAEPSTDEDGSTLGEVVYIDVFGNICTNLPAPEPGQSLRVEGPRRLAIEGPVRRSYGEVEIGELLLLENSFGRLELAINHGDAAERFGLKVGDPIRVRGG